MVVFWGCVIKKNMERPEVLTIMVFTYTITVLAYIQGKEVTGNQKLVWELVEALFMSVYFGIGHKWAFMTNLAPTAWFFMQLAILMVPMIKYNEMILPVCTSMGILSYNYL